MARIGLIGGALWALSGTAFAGPVNDSSEQGVIFNCPTAQYPGLAQQVSYLLAQLNIAPEVVQVLEREDSTSFTLKGSSAATTTLDLIDRPELGVTEELVRLPRGPEPKAGTRAIWTVSRQEIALALMSPGRRTEFSGNACNIEAFRDHIGLRQTTVAWAQVLEWNWPNGARARWHTKFWSHGNLLKGRKVKDAVADAFYHQEKYAMGCFAAAKLVWAQGVLDYYSRVSPDARKLKEVETRLMRDGDPLVQVEPGAMWSFEPNVTAQDLEVPGKLLRLEARVSPRNMVPGDWVYFLNTDAATYEHTGYEGSNSVYLGRNKFSDYYNDHNHEYSFSEKLNEVYQWRHRVFSASRDVEKVRPLTAKDLLRLERTPEEGGILLEYRAVPYYFGYGPQ